MTVKKGDPTIRSSSITQTDQANSTPVIFQVGDFKCLTLGIRVLLSAEIITRGLNDIQNDKRRNYQCLRIQTQGITRSMPSFQ